MTEEIRAEHVRKLGTNSTKFGNHASGKQYFRNFTEKVKRRNKIKSFTGKDQYFVIFIMNKKDFPQLIIKNTIRIRDQNLEKPESDSNSAATAQRS